MNLSGKVISFTVTQNSYVLTIPPFDLTPNTAYTLLANLYVTSSMGKTNEVKSLTSLKFFIGKSALRVYIEGGNRM
jgi:hypothetical protein